MKFAYAAKQIISILILAASIAGCQQMPFSGTPTPTVLFSNNIEKLNFQDSETKKHFDSLNRCFKKIVDPNWKEIPSQLNGNFYRSTWCYGAGTAADCRLPGSSENNKDQHLLSLYTLTYPQDISSVFGLGFEALWVPAKNGWGAFFSFSENGKGIVGDYWGVRFNKYTAASDQIESTTVLGYYDQYQIQETLVGYSFDLPLREDLALYLKSGEEMRDRRLEQIQALEQKVKTTIETHQAVICELGPYEGNGIPPKCTPRALIQSEETDEMAKAENYFSDQKRILNENYQDLFAAWMQAFPMDRCWP